MKKSRIAGALLGAGLAIGANLGLASPAQAAPVSSAVPDKAVAQSTVSTAAFAVFNNKNSCRSDRRLTFARQGNGRGTHHTLSRCQTIGLSAGSYWNPTGCILTLYQTSENDRGLITVRYGVGWVNTWLPRHLVIGWLNC